MTSTRVHNHAPRERSALPAGGAPLRQPGFPGARRCCGGRLEHQWLTEGVPPGLQRSRKREISMELRVCLAEGTLCFRSSAAFKGTWNVHCRSGTRAGVAPPWVQKFIATRTCKSGLCSSLKFCCFVPMSASFQSHRWLFKAETLVNKNFKSLKKIQSYELFCFSELSVLEKGLW